MTAEPSQHVMWTPDLRLSKPFAIEAPIREISP